MPAPEPATPSPQPTVSATLQNVRPEKAQARKKRAAKRRARARNGVESDEEIEREVASSDSDDDDNDDRDQSSSSESATDDSDTEPGSDDVPTNIPSPGTSKDVGVERVTHINGAAAPFFTNSLAWSEIVADENENGAAGLPVIDFANFSDATKIPVQPLKKPQKQKKKKIVASTLSAPPTQQSVLEEPSAEPESPTETASLSLPRKFGQTARQAYQERLEKDPSYVPKVGGFWGHDDRLMDKDLRSLSGWWRGQWQGRGRGRGRGFGMRGGAHGGHDSHTSEEVAPAVLPPIERNWTHDGFEEMKRKEDERQAHQEAPAGRGRGGFRGGRGGFVGRGRGPFRPHLGSSPVSPLASRVFSPGPRPGRVWFAMKPEATWSKQSCGFLFLDSSVRSGNPRYRVKVPGRQGMIAQGSRPAEPTEPKPMASPSTRSVETKELHYVVRLPRWKQEQRPATEHVALTPQTDEAAPANRRLESVSAPAPASTTAPAMEEEEEEGPHSSQPSPAVVSQLEQLSIEPGFVDPDRQAKTEEAVLRNPSQESMQEVQDISLEPRPPLPPLQTVFTPPPPVSHTSPVFGSPYTYPQTLPPGIGFNHHGMPYELATGRPVYLQPAAPPPPMYNPRPLMHSHHGPPGMSYGHVPHPSAMSPDFLSQPSHTPPMNGFIDPSTGAPIFSFPRPSARLEIRAPDDSHVSPTSNGKANRGPSKLRTTAMAFEPSRSSEGRYYPSATTPSDGSGLPPSYEAVNGAILEDNGQQQQHPMGPMMGYNPYQQQYYYPEAYGYPQYMDMSQQAGHYEGYNVDQGPQAAVYY